MSQSKWQMITKSPPSPGAPLPSKESGQNWNSLQKAPQTSKVGASDPASFSFGNLLFIPNEKFPERSTNSILTNVTHAGKSEGSQASPGYMLSRHPKVALDCLPRVVSACGFQRGSGAQLRQLLLAVDSGACLITQSQWPWLLPAWPPVGGGSTFFCQHHSQARPIFLNLLLTGRQGQLSTPSDCCPQQGPAEHFGRSHSTPVSKWTFLRASTSVLKCKPK